jgi:hypothetical protein
MLWDMIGGPMRILVIGNCQSHTFAKCSDILVPDVQFQAYEMQVPNEDLTPHLARYDRAYVQMPVYERMPEDLREKYAVKLFPRISFQGLHPDSIYLKYAEQRAYSAAGAYHSVVIFAGWYHGLSKEQTAALFSPKTARRLGWERHFSYAKRAMISEGQKTGIDLAPLLDNWLKAKEPFMLTMNHPALEPVFDLAKAVLERDGFPVRDHGIRPEHNLLRYPIMPVYPAVAEPLGLMGNYLFKKDERLRGGAGILDLAEFIDKTFKIYEQWDRALIDPCVATEEPYVSLCEEAKTVKVAVAVSGNHPYKGVPAHQNWRKSVSSVAAAAVDPVVSGQFRLGPGDKVATAGSCFAQHLAKALSRSGLNYYVPEKGEARLGYGLFSCRYGNVYTSAQLNQLIDRAYGRFVPADGAWRTTDGLWTDPFRPEMPLLRRDSAQAIEEQRVEHFGYVRQMIETMDYFVFTLGLTEAWRSKTDGAVFPIAPGVAAGEMDPAKYEFVNFDVDEVRADLYAAMEKIWAVNPRVRFVLTVSPVPLMATFEPRHVLVSTTYSKSVLRTAAEEVARREGVFYFPSYEIITGNFNRGAYYAEDLREVREEGVDHVMRLFLKHCAETSVVEVNDPQMRRIEANNDVLCAENMLDA